MRHMVCGCSECVYEVLTRVFYADKPFRYNLIVVAAFELWIRYPVRALPRCSLEDKLNKHKQR